jgi:hypothetical protein
LPLDEIDTIANLPRELQTIYIDNGRAIQTHSIKGKHLSTFNFFHSPSDLMTTDWRAKLVDTIFNTQTKRFKINYSHHLILKHKITGKYRFFHASLKISNILDRPVLISNPYDFADFVEQLNNSDILDYALCNSPIISRHL